LSLTLAPLTAQHRLAEFDSGKPALNEWLLRHAAQAQASGSARTFVALDGQRVAGYFSLTVGQVVTTDVAERVRKGMGSYPIPVVILARLAVSVQDQGRGIGAGLLQEAIVRTLQLAEIAGVRALLTHPIDEQAARFYRRFGFEASPIREQQLLLLLKDARKAAAFRHPTPTVPQRTGN
jgi:predicted N-acetyltransferase YhbS